MVVTSALPRAIRSHISGHGSAGAIGFKTEQGALAALAAFSHQRQIQPDRRVGGGEIDANLFVAAG